MKSLVSNLKLKRLQHGYSQQGLSCLTGIQQVSISYAERGYHQALDTGEWEKLAKALDCQVSDILPEKNEQKIERNN